MSGIDPETGEVGEEPTATINMLLLFKVTFVALMFVMIGGRISKRILKVFGETSGFMFTGRNSRE